MNNGPFIIIAVKEDRYAIPIIDGDSPSEDIAHFDTLEEAEKCAAIQPFCEAYGGYIMDLSNGQTHDI